MSLQQKLPKDEIFLSISTGNLDNLKKLIQPEQVNSIKDRSGHTLLYMATNADKIDVAKWLVSIGADVNQHCNGHSVLSLALSKCNYDLFYYYLDNNADCKGRNQLNLLHDASNKNRLDIVELLISKGADPNQLNNSHQTPLTLSIYQKNLDICKYLLDNGACANIPDKKGNTQLHLACSIGNFELIDLIIENAECDLKIKNQQDETPLDLLWTTAIKDAKAPLDLLNKFIKQGGMFSVPWNFTFNCHNHIVFIKCMSLLCKYRLSDLFLNEKRRFTELIIKGYWRNSLIVSIKSAVIDHKISTSEEQQELYKSIETIVLSGELDLNASELVSTFYMFDEINDLDVYKSLNTLFSSPFKLSYLCRIALRKNLNCLNKEFINQLKLPEQLRKFLIFEEV